ncbi:MAG TPA: high frequency lysogenization protein HflD [Rhodanobacteraceae bacterium]|nr:high frequency lysogenization protein HflD [Rhodanobacteraceae bacterium]
MNEGRTLALAGMFQSAALVRELAQGRSVDEDAAETSIRSIFTIDADDVAHVYGGSAGLKLGLQVLIRQLEQPRREIDLSRLVLAMLHLERKLVANKSLTLALAEGINLARRQLDHFGPLHANVQGRLGELYEQTLSTIRPRVMVHGDPQVLAQASQAARIRATLLAGVRSAVLWRQLGGRQWQLLLGRRQCVMMARGLLSQTNLQHGV